MLTNIWERDVKIVAIAVRIVVVCAFAQTPLVRFIANFLQICCTSYKLRQTCSNKSTTSRISKTHLLLLTYLLTYWIVVARWSAQYRAHVYKLKFHGTDPTPTPTRTLGMRLSCNFVNVYTIVYRVQYTYTCTRAHPQRISSQGKARIVQKSADKSADSSHAERAARAAAVPTFARGSSRGSRRCVGVRVGPVEFKLYTLYQTCTWVVGWTWSSTLISVRRSCLSTTTSVTQTISSTYRRPCCCRCQVTSSMSNNQ